MAAKILQLAFKFSISKAEYEQTASAIAGNFAALPGLRWKIWLMNEAESEAGGIYFFNDDTSLKAYLDGPLMAQLKSHPALSEMQAKVFDVMDAASATTRGPIS
jgi:hypothetical protein